jgi:hypothetical protein
MKATDWQAHSVRGFISTAGKRHKVNIESAKNESGDRVYRITKYRLPGRLTQAAAVKIKDPLARLSGRTSLWIGEAKRVY